MYCTKVHYTSLWSDVVTKNISAHPLFSKLDKASGRARLQQLSRMISGSSSLPKYIDEESKPTVVSSGLPSLDRLLRYKGVRLGTLMEWFESDGDSVASASGATTLALAVAVHLQTANELSARRPVVLVDRARSFYPPSIMPWLESAPSVLPQSSSNVRGHWSKKNTVNSREEHLLYIVYPANEADEFWTIDQLLRCPSIAAVVGWPACVSSLAMRRWQLAARSSGAVGLFVRPSRARHEPTWAEARIQVGLSHSLRNRYQHVSSCGNVDSARLQSTSGHWIHSRAFTLMQVGGQWDAMVAISEPSVECVLDLTNGKEHVGFHETHMNFYETTEQLECQGKVRRVS